MKKYLSLLLVAFLAGCAAGPLVRTMDGGIYADGMQGAENLCFDGRDVMYVSGLDGRVFKVKAADGHGRIVSEARPGELCLGMEYFEGHLYVGVQREGDRFMEGRILRLDPDLGGAVDVSGPVPGLNGFALADGWLYYTSSTGFMKRRGTVYRVCLGGAAGMEPEVFLSGIGWVNGLAFNQDRDRLYYTEMFGGVWEYDLISGERRSLYDPGFLRITDDLTVAADGSLFVCANSWACILHLGPEGKLLGAWRPEGMGIPSSCRTGGPGFGDSTLYITEFGIKQGSLRQDGRGVWTLELEALEH